MRPHTYALPPWVTLEAFLAALPAPRAHIHLPGAQTPPVGSVPATLRSMEEGVTEYLLRE